MIASIDTRRALLARLLQDKVDRAAGVYPLSHNQRALWFIHQADPQSTAYTVLWSARLCQRLDRDALQAACRSLVQRHEMLRTTFFSRQGEPRQRIHERLEPAFIVVDLGPVTDAALRHAALEKARHPFDLETGPLVRLHVLSRAVDDHLLLFTAHHIVMDGAALSIAFDELLRAYAQGTGLPVAPVTEPEARYVDFVDWQSAWIASEGANSDAFWRARLEGLEDAALPDDEAWLSPAEEPTGSYRFELGAAQRAALSRLGQAQGVSVNVILFTAFQASLARLAGKVPPVAVIASGRTTSRFERVMGDCINPVVITAPDHPADITTIDVMQRNAEALLEALEHQDLPFAKVVECLGGAQERGRSTLFRYVFLYQQLTQGNGFQELYALDDDAREIAVHGVPLRPFKIRQQEGQLDLTLEVVELEDRLVGFLKYHARQFARRTISRLAHSFTALVAKWLEWPQTPWRELGARLGAEADLHRQWHVPSVADDNDLLLARLYRLAVNDPDAMALDDGRQTLARGALAARVQAAAAMLRANGVGGPGDRVAICMGRSIDAITAMLAVLQCGAAYVPIDPDLPAARIEDILVDCAPQVALVDGSAPTLPVASVRLDRFEWVDGAPATRTRSPRADDPAYVLYTSGSTGRPKGAINTHGAIARHVSWLRELCPLDATDRVLQKTPYSFDVSVSEIFWALTSGATLVIARPDGHRDPVYLTRTIADAGITALRFVPAQLRTCLDAMRQGDFAHLRWAVVSGEALPLDLVHRFNAATDATLFNFYGPTEAAVDVTWWNTRDIRPDQDLVPIGRPFPGTRLYVVDANLRPVPIGALGELIIVGPQVANGYLNRPELTAEKFIDDPLSSRERAYRTGDIARWLPDGTLEYRGRADHQIKLRGYRIELGEIDACLLALDGVKAAVTVVRGQGTDRALVAYVVPAARGGLVVDEVKAALSARLPDYMVPARLVTLDALPINASGKIDRKALPEPSVVRVAPVAGQDLPRTAMEASIAT
ncbi:MAG: amino acid adenylation domain-containing protein, partial [Myxococcales bacterium]|nr:amino acid adenylation domain-containing protein [Myxococcales bacterium]